MRSINKAQWNDLIKEIGAPKTNYKENIYIQITDNIFVELDFFSSNNYFGVDIQDGVYSKHGETTGADFLHYSTGYTPNIIPRVMELVKEYVGNTPFEKIKSREQLTQKSFENFFEDKTGISYRDLNAYS